ncbi:MAG: cytidylate kinase-like family protein [Acidimicrobiia bacterium]|nr:cytidylate kinase-like family protein [Acidimicrobiia bacterium]
MSPANPIERFLHGHMYDKRAEGGLADRPRPFVTISRQAGAGGHTLAQALIARFDEKENKTLFGEWEMFDQKLVAMVADDPDLRVSVEALLGEEYRKAADDFFRQLLTSTTHQDIVMDRMFRLVRTIAEVGKAVIVGRAGSEVTRGLGPSVSVRLIAPEEFRVKHMMELNDLSEKKATELIDKHDSGRARMLKRHFRVNIDDPLLYDAVWNTAQVAFDDIAESIATMLETRAKAFQAG